MPSAPIVGLLNENTVNTAKPRGCISIEQQTEAHRRTREKARAGQRNQYEGRRRGAGPRPPSSSATPVRLRVTRPLHLRSPPPSLTARTASRTIAISCVCMVRAVVVSFAWCPFCVSMRGLVLDGAVDGRRLAATC